MLVLGQLGPHATKDTVASVRDVGCWRAFGGSVKGTEYEFG